MKSINDILAEFDLATEQVTAITKAVNENYRTIAEVEKKTARIKELEEQNGTLAEQIKGLEGNGEQVETLRQQVEQYEQAEAQRKAAEEERAKRDSFRSVFNAALNGREFANDLMAETIFERVYTQCQDNAGTGASEALESLTKDTEGVWKNPQTDPHKMPNAADLDTKKKTQEETDRQTILNFLKS